jgi:signal transduction histidine kinase
VTEDDDRLIRLAARGALSGAVTSELAAPLAHITEVLGELVDSLDRHVAAARGPEPLSWNAVGDLRQKLADAFIDLGRVRRLAADLATVSLDRPGRHPELVDANDLVERALSLARHRFSGDQDVLLDLGTLPSVEVDPTRMVRALAHLFLVAADAAGPGATIVIRTACDRAGCAVLSLSFPGRPQPSAFSAFAAAELAVEAGGLTYSEADGLTTAFVALRVAK